VRDQLQQRFLTSPHPNASRVAVVPCHDPQLVVVRGLLLDQQQRWLTNNTKSVLAWRVARASYGVIVKQTYSPALHFDEEVRVDVYDKTKKWAINQIQWLIRKGDTVDPNVPLVKSFEISLAEGDLTRAWDATIVMSQYEPSSLPSSMRKGASSPPPHFSKGSCSQVDRTDWRFWQQLARSKCATSAAICRASGRSS